MAAAVRLQIEEIKTLADRSLAYASLLQLQQLSADDLPSIEALALCSSQLIPLIISDIYHQDEEIAAQALKCLGFMLYHPSLVSAISEGDSQLVFGSLVKLITTTRMKAVCNLGVWCISIQQLSASLIGEQLYSLLRAVVHAVDNPFGSLATTFEGMQAMMKLAAQLCDKMRETSDMWVPPIYRRLISTDKRERDMAERCILKTKSIIYPPSSTLSEIVKTDIQKNLLPRMMTLLRDQEQKIHLIKAWGWYMFLLGSDALSNRYLLNELLKVPEHTFTDRDPQVLIASLVAWESLVDALLPPQAKDLDTKIIQQNELSRPMTPMRHCDNQIPCLLRRIKVIMLPLQHIISSKYDISVRSACLNTWHYLLHKLGHLISHPSVVMASFAPILEVIFSRGPDKKSICLWASCLDLLDDCVLSKVKVGKVDLNSEDNFVNKIFPIGSHVNRKILWKHYPIKWLPWEIGNLNFYLKLISTIASQGLTMTLTPENRTLAFDAASRIFRSVLQGVQVELLSTDHDRIQFCMNTVLKFAREICENMASKTTSDQCNDFLWMTFLFIKAIIDELDSSILASPLFQIPLDLQYINMQSLENIQLPIQGLAVSYLSYMDMVLPMVYTTILHLCAVAESMQYLSAMDEIPRAMQHWKYLFFAVNPSINLQAIICFFYMHIEKPVHVRLYWLTIWRVIGECLKETIDSINELSFLESEYDNTGCTMIHWFLCYPLLVFLSPEKVSASPSNGSCSELSLDSLRRELELELVIEVWKSVFDSSTKVSQITLSSNCSFSEGLCKILVGVLDENMITLQGSIMSCFTDKSQNTIFLLLFGEVAVHILKQSQVLDVIDLESTMVNQEPSKCEQCSPIKNGLGLIARFLGLLLTCASTSRQSYYIVINRVFAAMSCLVGRISMKRDILLLMEIISDPMVQRLSLCASIYDKTEERSIICQLQYLWSQIVDCLQRSKPPIVFDSFLLGVQAPLLQTTLDHVHHSISDASIAFWKATYGQKTNLSYPRCLLPVLAKLLRNGKINPQKESTCILLNNRSSVKEVSGALQRYNVTFMPKRTLGLDIIEESDNGGGCTDVVNMGSGRKRFKIAKHQLRETSAHQERFNNLDIGPRGVADISRVFKHQLMDKEVRKSDYIMDMLRRAR